MGHTSCRKKNSRDMILSLGSEGVKCLIDSRAIEIVSLSA